MFSDFVMTCRTYLDPPPLKVALGTAEGGCESGRLLLPRGPCCAARFQHMPEAAR